jgi:DNA-directed RNA polymerase specialized sigma24 family protein
MNLPFSYEITKWHMARLTGANVHDPDFEDRFQDTMLLFLENWNGHGNPVGAFRLMYKQWYSHKRRAKYHDMLVLLGDVPASIAGRCLPWDSVGAGDDYQPVLDQIQEDQSYNNVLAAQLMKHVQALTEESERNQVLFRMRVLGHEYHEIADDLDMTRQRVEQVYHRMLNKLLNKIKG